MQQAVESPLLETSIKGAKNVIINIRGDISLMDANDAASYVQEMVGDEAQIIFGAMYDDTEVDVCRITVIATGLVDEKKFEEQEAAKAKARETKKQASAYGTYSRPAFLNQAAPQPAPQAPQARMNLQQPKGQSSVPQQDIQIPDFLKNRSH